jgi:hypothetical protein
MRKSIFESSTTQSVSAAGATVGATLTAAQMLEQMFPESAILTNPAVTGFATFLMTTFVLPWLSRQIARIRGK